MSSSNRNGTGAPEGHEPPPGQAPLEGDVEVLEELSIVNEFGLARVRKIRTRNGERLEIHSPRFGYTVRLDALALEALSWQSPRAISELLVTPIGPEQPGP